MHWFVLMALETHVLLVRRVCKLDNERYGRVLYETPWQCRHEGESSRSAPPFAMRSPCLMMTTSTMLPYCWKSVLNSCSVVCSGIIPMKSLLSTVKRIDGTTPCWMSSRRLTSIFSNRCAVFSLPKGKGLWWYCAMTSLRFTFLSKVTIAAVASTLHSLFHPKRVVQYA